MIDNVITYLSALSDEFIPIQVQAEWTTAVKII